MSSGVTSRKSSKTQTAVKAAKNIGRAVMPVPVVDIDPVKRSAINPATGAVWRLTDKEVSEKFTTFKSELANPEKALEFLKKHKLLTAAGGIPKKYGGR